MSHLVNLARAAQLLGMPRGTLQRMIRDGELHSFDGTLSTEELLRAFPAVRLDDAGLADAVGRIRDESFGRRIRERALPPQEVLAQRIFRQSEELGDLRRHLERYHALLGRARQCLDAVPIGSLRKELRELLDGGLAEILASDNRDDSLETMHAMLKLVSAQVTVRPSGREFVVEGRDTILQAGLKAGLRLNYGCGSGSCGLCKARIVSGEVCQTGHADYPLSEAERNSGVALACVCTPVTDVVIEALEAAGPEDIPAQEIVASVRAISPLAEDTLLLHVQTPRSARLRFLAGQSATLGLATPAGDIASTWPIASCPCDDRNLHFHVARDAADPLARQLFAGALKNGESINLRGPLGDFVLAGDGRRPLAFIAGDTGFAPVKSLIEHAIAVDDTDTFGLVWGAARADGHYLDNQCRMWAAAFDRFRYLPLAAADRGDPFAAEKLGVAAATAALDGLDFLADAEVYVAGPAAFVAAAEASLDAAGITRRRATVV